MRMPAPRQAATTKGKLLMTAQYPVPGRSELRNRRIAGHEIGHAFLARVLGNSVHSVTIIRDAFFEGRVIRSGPPSQIIFSDENPETKSDEIISVCERLERMSPESGSSRVADSELVVRAQCMIIELVGGLVAEQILHPDEKFALGAEHDHVEARAFARVACAAGASPAVQALLKYCEAEANALIRANFSIVRALVEELIRVGKMSGDEVDAVISREVAALSLETERQHRADWRTRQLNAAAFVTFRGDE
jgi:hypothetical protein